MRSKRSNGAAVINEKEAIEKAKASSALDDRAVKWQLTENNHEYSQRECLEKLSKIGSMVYGVAACEIGESGTKHIHAFVVYKNAIKLGSLKRAFPRAHFEHCRGSVASNREYVAKGKDEGDILEIGEMPIYERTEETNVSSEVVSLILEAELTPIEILGKYPRYCDYVVKNFRNLEEISAKAARQKRRF